MFINNMLIQFPIFLDYDTEMPNERRITLETTQLNSTIVGAKKKKKTTEDLPSSPLDHVEKQFPPL